MRQKFYSHRVVDIWNNLPQAVVDAPSVKSFERRLDKYWHNQDMVYDFEAAWKKGRPNRAGTNYETETESDLDT